jgi:putative oxidoreductase
LIFLVDVSTISHLVDSSTIQENFMTDFIMTVLSTNNGWIGLIARVTLGAVILPHGLQKLMGWFGGYGFTGTMGFFTGTMNLPWIIALLVILGESAGALLLITGLGTRFAAVWIGIIMVSAMLIVHLPNGFFMNWTGSQKGEGIEFFILVMGLIACILIEGGGRYSIDESIAN